MEIKIIKKIWIEIKKILATKPAIKFLIKNSNSSTYIIYCVSQVKVKMLITIA